MKTLKLFLSFALFLAVAGCTFDFNFDREQSSVSKGGVTKEALATALESSIRNCERDSGSEDCDFPDSFPSRLRGVVPTEHCQSGNFAALEAKIRFQTGHAPSLISFGRVGKKTWKALAIKSANGGSVEELCAAPPYRDSAFAGQEIKELKISFHDLEMQDLKANAIYDVVALDFSQFWMYGCAISKIEVVFGDGEQPKVVEPWCWIDDKRGLELEKPQDAMVFLPSTRHPSAKIGVVFVDGTRTGFELSNPYVSDWPYDTPRREKP